MSAVTLRTCARHQPEGSTEIKGREASVTRMLLWPKTASCCAAVTAPEVGDVTPTVKGELEIIAADEGLPALA